MIEIKKLTDHYAIYIDGKFWCTCESMREVTEELEEYEREDQMHHQATG